MNCYPFTTQLRTRAAQLMEYNQNENIFDARVKLIEAADILEELIEYFHNNTALSESSVRNQVSHKTAEILYTPVENN